MHRGDPRKAGIVRVQSGCDGRETGHQPIDSHVRSIGPAQKVLDLTMLTHSESCALPLDQRRSSEEQTVLGAGKAQIALTVFA